METVCVHMGVFCVYKGAVLEGKVHAFIVFRVNLIPSGAVH